MKPVIILDSSPLALIVHTRDYASVQECRQWLQRLLAAGARVVVPEIVNFEIRRELLRLGKQASLAALASFNGAAPGRFLPITSAALDLAAELWAQARRQGQPTADPHSLDIDTILAAQVLTAGFNATDFVVATSNASHLSLFVPAQPWESITAT